MIEEEVVKLFLEEGYQLSPEAIDVLKDREKDSVLNIISGILAIRKSVSDIWVSLLVKYEIQIDRTLCIACGTCCSLNSTHFEPSSEEKSSVIGGETDENSSLGTFDDEEIESAKQAEDSCPVSAITVTAT